ncbi:hypothetical protein JMJ77_0010823 [Colletotrichum scovillei]|uniref:Uncharacterized protein n=1 Tax=Colletotrichum scovillei TaxID=1209932 RepID=A0A9P7UAP9_9PEZI|nr:hypothetical protein JMJ77_0010823 [Colletotrichum scovillei]KAG7059789.1 hypothetical protein JMJ78_0015078 [Colletotrichum scovillei]KAG7067236.1 hypothetical protein JMJ76_0008679 [Colletotrichum scovillei]
MVDFVYTGIAISPNDTAPQARHRHPACFLPARAPLPSLAFFYSSPVRTEIEDGDGSFISWDGERSYWDVVSLNWIFAVNIVVGVTLLGDMSDR